MKKLFFLFITCLFVYLMHAQKISVKGRIMDTLEHKGLQNAVVSLLSKKDSSLTGFSRSDKNGFFQLNGFSPGRYILLITYPKFADFSDEFNFRAGDVNDLGNISLTLKSKLLDAIFVRSSGSIRIKGDTTEFIADSFHVKDGATVEDLLKRFPGFQVNSKGEITAQGQKVEKVLVDGEEFFGNDPTMATQNISAKAVDKVQLFDTKSEQQQLTGITNPSDGKTLNIKLKENQKKGAFGKVYAGTDFGKYYDAKGLFNNFVGKRKISAYASKSTVNAGSLSWQDKQKLGLDNDMQYDEIGGYYFSFGSSDEFSDWNLRGIPDSYTAGGLFSNKWNADQDALNGSYAFNRLHIINNAATYTENILQNTINYRNIFTNSNVVNQQHAVNGKYEWKIDSLASLKFITAGIYKTSDLYSTVNSEFLNADKSYVNKSSQARENHTKRYQTDNQLSYKQSFKKKDRLLLTTLRFGYIKDDQNGINKTSTDFFKNGIIDSTDIQDQMKIYSGSSQTLGVKTTYSEPLSARLALILDYSFNQNRSNSDRQTFNKSANGKYEVLDTLYSNNFDLYAYSHSSSAIFRYIDTKLRVSAGTGLSAVKLNLQNKFTNVRNSFNFLNLTPQAQISYTLKPQERISFNYRGNTVQPNISQLQPIRDNNDPLNVFIGNPELRVGFSHNLNVFFSNYKVLSSTGIFFGGNYNIVQNAITTYNTIDIITGKQISMPVNVNGNSNWGFWGNWFKEAEKKLSPGLQLNGNGSHNVNFLNGQKNTTDYTNFTLGPNLGYNSKDKFNFDLNPQIGYSNSISSLQPGVRNNYFTYGGRMNAFLNLKHNLELNTDMNANLQQKLNGFAPGINSIVWNAAISKKIFKDKSGKIIFLANDILNQNKGFNRTINSNYITEDHYSRISRYFLLKFEWTINKLPGNTN